jgi:toxin ParE1/3/4
MSGVLLIKPQVYFDLDEIAAWMQRDDPKVALRFLDAAEATFQSLAEFPGMGAPFRVRNPRWASLRSFPIQGFPNHLVFYVPIAGGIDVVRVLHGARNLPPIFEQE